MANLYSKLQEKIIRGGGVAKSNQFRVVFPDLTGGIFNYPDFPVNFDRSTLEVLCNQASLPAATAATQQVNGYYTGSSYKYPTMKLFGDLSLSFICDSNMTAFKVMNSWFDRIFQEKSMFNQKEKIPEDMSHYPERDRNRFTRIAYPESYQRTIIVDKFEAGPRYSEQGRSVRYFFTNAYPYSIDAVPLDAGIATLMTCTVNFHYERYELQYEDARKNLESTTNNITGSGAPTDIQGAIDNVKDAFNSFTSTFNNLF